MKAEAERAEQAAAIERTRIQQNATPATIGQLREQIGTLQDSVKTLKNERKLVFVESHPLGAVEKAKPDLELTTKAANGEKSTIHHVTSRFFI
jgi:hypothetical protein